MLDEKYIEEELERKIEYIMTRKKEIEQGIAKERLEELEEVYKRAEKVWKELNKEKMSPIAVPITVEEWSREEDVLRRLSELHPTL